MAVQARHIRLFKHQIASINMVRKHPEIPYIFLIGGFGCGKSFTDVQLCLFLYQCYHNSPEPIQIGVFGVTIKLLKQTVLADLERAFDQAGIPYRDNSQAGTLTVGAITFVYLAMQNPDDIYAFNFTCCLCDEIDELPAEKVEAVVKAVQERNRVMMPDNRYFGRRQPFVFFSTTAQGMAGTYNLTKKLDKQKVPYAVIRARTQDNTSLPKEQLELLRKLYTKEEADAFLDGKFVNLSTGRVYHSFNRKDHVCMRFPVLPTDTIYVGGDFNCISGSSLIATSEGLIRMDKMRVGMKVLTRKGYRRVLAVLPKGIQTVEKYNSLIATGDHRAITEEGDICLNRTKYLWTLPLASLKRLAEDERVFTSMESVIKQMTTDILSAPTQSVRDYIGRFGNITTEKFLRVALYIILTKIRQITGLKTSVASLDKNIKIFIDNICSMRTNSMNAMQKEELLLLKPGLTASIQSMCHAIDVVSNSGLHVRLPATATTVNYRTGENLKQPDEEVNESQIMVSLLESVKSVVQNLRELQPLCTAMSIRSTGNVRHGDSHEEEVYDLMIEDMHEFFADGVLVHNCGYNANIQLIVRGGIVYAVDGYHYGDMAQCAEHLRRLYPSNKIVFLPDVNGKEIMQGFAEEFEQANIEILWNGRNPGIAERIMAVNLGFRRGQLKVMEPREEGSDLRGLEQTGSLLDKFILGLETRDFDDMGKPRKGKGPNAFDHGDDAFEYSYWHILHTVNGFDEILTALKGVQHGNYE